MALSSLQDLKSKKLWLAIFAEFMGTAFLVLVACGSCGRFKVETDEINPIINANETVVKVVKFLPHDLVQISLCFGLSVASIVWSIAHVSGGHINPGVTIGFLVTRKISLVRGLLYVSSQTLGAVCGAFTLRLLTPIGVNDGLGSPDLGRGVGIIEGTLVEFLITFVLVLTVFATCDSNRNGPTGSGPLAIGLSIAMCHLWAIPYTGSGMNPARTFGSHSVSGTLTHSKHWLYWVGPLMGGALAGLIYDLLLAANAGPAKLGSFFSLDYDDEEFDARGRRRSNDPNLTSIRLKDNA